MDAYHLAGLAMEKALLSKQSDGLVFLDHLNLDIAYLPSTICTKIKIGDHFFFWGGRGKGERGREMVTLGNLEDIVTQKVKNQAYWNKHIFNCRKACQL